MKGGSYEMVELVALWRVGFIEGCVSRLSGEYCVKGRNFLKDKLGIYR